MTVDFCWCLMIEGWGNFKPSQKSKKKNLVPQKLRVLC